MELNSITYFMRLENSEGARNPLQYFKGLIFAPGIEIFGDTLQDSTVPERISCFSY